LNSPFSSHLDEVGFGRQLFDANTAPSHRQVCFPFPRVVGRPLLPIEAGQYEYSPPCGRGGGPCDAIRSSRCDHPPSSELLPRFTIPPPLFLYPGVGGSFCTRLPPHPEVGRFSLLACRTLRGLPDTGIGAKLSLDPPRFRIILTTAFPIRPSISLPPTVSFAS